MQCQHIFLFLFEPTVLFFFCDRTEGFGVTFLGITGTVAAIEYIVLRITDGAALGTQSAI